MSPWSPQIEDELAVLLKDWLKQQGRTQADLRRSLQAVSTRMPALIEVLKREYSLGGLPKVAARLCAIEDSWSNKEKVPKEFGITNDPFDQLDLLLEEIREDCENETNPEAME